MKKSIAVSLAASLALNALVFSSPAQATDCVITGVANGIFFNAGGLLPVAACAAETATPFIAPISAPVTVPMVAPVAVMPVAPIAPMPISVMPIAPTVPTPVVPTVPAPLGAPAEQSLLGIPVSSLILGAAALGFAWIASEIVSGRNKPPVGPNTLVCEGFGAASGKSYRYQPGIFGKPIECQERPQAFLPTLPTPIAAPRPTALTEGPVPLPRVRRAVPNIPTPVAQPLPKKG
jgi:hypothetical protein